MIVMKKRRYRRKNVKKPKTSPKKISGNILNKNTSVTSLSRKSMKTIFTWLDTFLSTSPETLFEF